MSIIRSAVLTAVLLASTALPIQALQANDRQGQISNPSPATGEEAFNEIQHLLRMVSDPWGEGGEIISLAHAQAMVREDEAVLMMAPSVRETYMVVLRRGAVRWYRADVSGNQLFAAARHLRGQLDGPQAILHRGPDPVVDARETYDRLTAWAVYSRLLGPVEATLQGASRVTVIAAGAVQHLPFSALVTAPPEGEDSDPSALRATAWLGDRHVFVSAPSLSQWRQSRSTPQTSGPHFYIGFGDPVPPQPDATALSRLPQTRTEVLQVAGLFSADRQTIRLGDQASEQSVKSENLERATILHFATLGLAAGRVPLPDGPALVLTPSATEDGWLTSGEVARLQLTADFVIASGCSTYGEMADAFLRAGARSGLAVDGAVSDEVAAEFVTALVTAAIEETNGDYVRAFQRARAKLRARPDNRYAHPAAWAQFGLFGDPPIARPDTAR